MGYMKQYDIVLRELHEANVDLSALIDAIEDELEFAVEDCEWFVGDIMDARLDGVFAEFADNLDELFLDNGISVMTYEGVEFVNADDSLQRIVAEDFARSIIASAREQLQFIIDERSM